MSSSPSLVGAFHESNRPAKPSRQPKAFDEATAQRILQLALSFLGKALGAMFVRKCGGAVFEMAILIDFDKERKIRQ